jgi:hypothetical protein
VLTWDIFVKRIEGIGAEQCRAMSRSRDFGRGWSIFWGDEDVEIAIKAVPRQVACRLAPNRCNQQKNWAVKVLPLPAVVPDRGLAPLLWAGGHSSFLPWAIPLEMGRACPFSSQTRWEPKPGKSVELDRCMSKRTSKRHQGLHQVEAFYWK